MKFDPLSLNISLGFPLRAIKRLKVRRKSSDNKCEANSIWIAHTVKPVEITPYLFAIA